MRVDAATLGLISTVVSTVVVVVGALAAVRQLRHLRHANELATLGSFAEQWESPPMREARDFVRSQLATALSDASFVEELRSVPAGPRGQLVARVFNHFETIAIYAHAGALSERMVMMLWGSAAISYWGLLRDTVAITRSTRPYALLDYFEDFAMRAPRWHERESARRRALKRDPGISHQRGLPAGPT